MPERKPPLQRIALHPQRSLSPEQGSVFTRCPSGVGRVETGPIAYDHPAALTADTPETMPVETRQGGACRRDGPVPSIGEVSYAAAVREKPLALTSKKNSPCLLTLA